jgi:ribosomal protein L11 methyltransferase
MDYYQYTFKASPEVIEFLPAFLEELPFDTFQEEGEALNAFVPIKDDSDEITAHLAALQEQFDFSYEKTLIPAQNWNEVWESNFQPIVIDNFCAVRADFHPSFGDKVKHELVIVPKMAFGTGHHETTYMCLSALEDIDVKGQKLLDYGGGTGILAILAAKLGAAEIEAVDIEEESYLSCIENSRDNGVDNITSRWGTIDAVEGRDFDGILANINRNVILASLPRLAELSKTGAWLLTSGFLLSDEEIIVDTAESYGFELTKIRQKGNWLSILFKKE